MGNCKNNPVFGFWMGWNCLFTKSQNIQLGIFNLKNRLIFHNL